MGYPAAFDPAIGLLSGAVLVALLALAVRRIGAATRRRPRGAPSPSPADYGLLVPVATVPTRDDAELLRSVLAEHRIRSTLATADTRARRSPVHVLVFPSDAARARDVLATR